MLEVIVVDVQPVKEPYLSTLKKGYMDALIQENQAHRKACQDARVAHAAAYGRTVEAEELPSVGFIAKRSEEEARTGSFFWKFFTT